MSEKWMEEAAERENVMPELLDWLRERHDNCIKIAAQKSGSDAAGWLDDAKHFELAIRALAERKG